VFDVAFTPAAYFARHAFFATPPDATSDDAAADFLRPLMLFSFR